MLRWRFFPPFISMVVNFVRFTFYKDSEHRADFLVAKAKFLHKKLVDGEFQDRPAFQKLLSQLYEQIHRDYHSGYSRICPFLS